MVKTVNHVLVNSENFDEKKKIIEDGGFKNVPLHSFESRLGKKFVETFHQSTKKIIFKKNN